MKSAIIKLWIILGLGVFSFESSAQEIHPDKFINYLKKDPESLAFSFPGWFIKMGGRIAARDVDDQEAQVIRELTGHIKKLRFVVSEKLPVGFDEKYKALKNHLKTNNYESLIEARDEGTHINLWASFDGNTIKRMVISVMEPDSESVFFNIKSNIDLERLKQMQFYQEWKSL